MTVYEKKLKGTERFLPLLLGLLENLAKSEFIRGIISYFFKFLKLSKITRYLDMDALPI